MTDNFEVDMQEDFTQAYDARAIKRLIDKGEPLSTIAAEFGYTPSQAKGLLLEYGFYGE
jgi:hypothetical protein